MSANHLPQVNNRIYVVDKTFFDNYGPFSLHEIAKIAEAEIYIPTDLNPLLDESFLVKDVNNLDLAGADDLSFFSNPKYIEQFKVSKAGVCIARHSDIASAPQHMILLLTENVYLAYAKVASAFYPLGDCPGFIAPSAIIDSSAKIGTSCYIGHYVVIGKNVTIGDHCRINHHSFIDKAVTIGHHCLIDSNVKISNSVIGSKAIIHAGAAIGQDGFGFATTSTGVHIKVPQLGRVLIGDDVEIGANTCIDRGAIKDTVIGDNCKIDNLVQIGHNVNLGKGCIIVAQVGISGSTNIGNHVVIGGQVGIAGHLHIGDGAQVAAQSGVMSNIPPREVQGGSPALPIRQWHKQSVILKKLTLSKKSND
jgi:UDP-3-O-[3-hydroxymyristoyl] glucosamine N-acyltransferase